MWGGVGFVGGEVLIEEENEDFAFGKLIEEVESGLFVTKEEILKTLNGYKVKILFDKTFSKDISELKDKKIANILKEIINEFEKKESILNISGIKKIKGYKFYYRKRIGDYRIGFKYENNEIIFINAQERDL